MAVGACDIRMEELLDEEVGEELSLINMLRNFFLSIISIEDQKNQDIYETQKNTIFMELQQNSQRITRTFLLFLAFVCTVTIMLLLPCFL